MRKMIFGLIATLAISATTFASSPIVKDKKIETILSLSKTETVNAKALAPTDFAGMICWLFGGHCTPVK